MVKRVLKRVVDMSKETGCGCHHASSNKINRAEHAITLLGEGTREKFAVGGSGPPTANVQPLLMGDCVEHVHMSGFVGGSQ